MPILFNTIRASIYGIASDFSCRRFIAHPLAGTVLLFTVICLSMAGHFQSVLAASDLSEYRF